MAQPDYPPHYNIGPSYNYPIPGSQQYPPWSGHPDFSSPHRNYPEPAYRPPITNQPIIGHRGADDGLINIPMELPNCPPGLEILSEIGQLFVRQKDQTFKSLLGVETKDRFIIQNNMRQNIYYVEEDSSSSARNCCGPNRPFKAKIFDNNKNMVILFSRPLACDNCCFPCCLQSIEIYAPPGQLVGRVRQQWNMCSPSFTIRNHADEIVLRIKGPCCPLKLRSDIEFKILSSDKRHQVGKITKEYSGLIKNNFSITFSMDLDVNIKAALLGACFLIDSMYFEQVM